ncbi:ankyrin repeat domain-containing protein [Orientia tsutsugamushi]|uniref:ankyrin repeat domain-containing protein n=1 Tax=Orientia tsutsugamushi TaxID=784 RepID=UPI000D5A4E91|nr:Uncharacterised protein [Orientia tsutsugamushi]
MNPEDIALLQDVALLIQDRQYLQARILVKNRGGFSDDDAAARELCLRVSEELVSEFISFCENMENCRTSSRYAALFFNGGDFPVNEGMYCSRIATDFYEQGRLNKQTSNTVFGGMVVNSVINEILMQPQQNAAELLDILLDYFIKTNLKYQYKNDETRFEDAKMERCADYLGTIGMNADNTNDKESRKRIACILENSGDPEKLLNFDRDEAAILMFRLLDRDCKESAELLFNSGLNLKHSQERGWLTFLDAAVTRNNVPFAKLLLQQGVEIVGDYKNLPLSPEMKALCNTYQFLKDTGYFKDQKLLPDQMLEDSLKISIFITQDKSLRSECWPALKSSVDNKTLLSQMAYEFRCDPSLLSYFVELTQLELSKLNVQSGASAASAASMDDDSKECSSTTHRDKYIASKSSSSTTDRSLN